MNRTPHTEYLREYRKQKVHRIIIFSQEEYQQLLHLAKKLKKPFSTLVREMALAQANNVYLMPTNEQLSSVQYLLKKLGTNINQLAHVANATLELPHDGIQFMQKEFAKLESDIRKVYHKPISLEEAIKNALLDDPETIKQIEKILQRLSK